MPVINVTELKELFISRFKSKFKPRFTSRFIKKVAKKAGMPPGSIIYTGNGKKEKVKIQIIDYKEDSFMEKEAKKVEDCFPFKKSKTVTWINITGIHKTEIIEKIGKHFELHPLIMEDIVTTNQRPKMEDFEKYLFVVLKMVFSNGNKFNAEQISIIFGDNFVISFQESEGDVFNPIRERIRNGKGKIRKMGADYLAYSLIDAIVDGYFIVLEKIGEQIEESQEKLLEEPSPNMLNIVHELKSELIFLRKSIWPLREVISALQRGDSKLIKKTTLIYLKDVYDHTIQVMDTLETFRDTVSGMVDIYLSSISNKMNEIMKVLTIIATIFIPLTFIVGVYGMNFKFMPELEWKWSYPILWAIILTVGITMIAYFKKSKWI